MLYSTAKEFVEWLYKEERHECFNDLCDDNKTELAGFILAEASDDEKAEIVSNLDDLSYVVSKLALSMQDIDRDKEKDFLWAIKISVANYLEKQIDGIFDDYKQYLKNLQIYN